MTMSWAWPAPGGVFLRTASCDANQSALCSSALLWWEVVGANQKGVPGVLPAHTRAVLKQFQGHLVDCLRRTRRDPSGPFVVRVPQGVDPQPVGAVLQGEGGGHPFQSGTVPWMATA